MNEPLIEVRNICLSYSNERADGLVLKNINLSINRGDFVSILGPSGSGKSTLFHILGLLLRPTEGHVFFHGIDTKNFSPDMHAFLRNRHIGFIFQDFHLLPHATALDNICLAARYPSEISPAIVNPRRKAYTIAERLGIEHILDLYPTQLSGGQQQRVSIARALMHDVDIILADEPTGKLDQKNARAVVTIFEELHQEGKTIIMITHDLAIAHHAYRSIELIDGTIHATHTLKKPHYVPDFIPARTFLPPRLPFHKCLQALFPEALAHIMRNRMKSFLMMLGIIIGSASLIVMLTLGRYTSRKIIQSYEILGSNKIRVYGYPNQNQVATDQAPLVFRSFQVDKDITPLKKKFTDIKRITPMLRSVFKNAAAGGKIIGENRVALMGIGPDYPYITQRKILLGHHLTEFHIENKSPVCVVGFSIAKQLFAHENPLGKLIEVTDNSTLRVPCRIIGVMQSIEKIESTNPPNYHVLVPYTYAIATSTQQWHSMIHEIILQINPKTVSSFHERLHKHFTTRYGNSGTFNIGNDSELISQMKRFIMMFAIFLTSSAIISLCVGGIGIHNMMLVSIAERIREFGIRKALGATDQSIKLQILIETMSLCSFAGFLGFLLGFFIYEACILLATYFVPELTFEWIIEPSAVAFSCFAICTVGIISGLLPALKTKKLNVTEALSAR